ncbi:MAG: P-type conjugative transfer ATPase TrbB [Fusobacterium sp.]|uniref:P-type conjugative transfer ATPase TrbB n=1 Tax=Fusobacterium sp. TaxID=68766 RepID=UPI0026DB9CE3|nr:P-type conjugative transfer ATPase TrbB [Fusobacterium sp.]MDO4689832.1 P-type conjugative transfer ATPase TrbB [Fusobacterium sp.]
MKSNLLDLLEISFGPQIMEYMNDEDVVEIMKNDDGKVFIDTLSQGMIFKGYMEADKALNIIYLVANHSGQEATVENPIISAELPGSGFRFEGNIPPLTTTAAFNIRKYSILELTLDDYVRDKIMSETQAKCIKEAVKERKNILVVGGTGSGKTTLCNAILSEMSQYNQRIIIIQDTNELKCSCENRLFMKTSEYVSMRKSLVSTLRRTPTRIVIGEVRDGAALNVLIAWNTGHPGGLCTLHADNAIKGIRQFESYIMEVSTSPQREKIGDTINLIIDLQREGLRRKVKGIIELKGYDTKKEEYILKYLT